MKKTFNILNLFLIIAVLVCDVCYIVFGGLWLKGLTSFLFVVIGITNLIFVFANKIEGQKKFAVIMLIGLIFAMVGDVVINIVFVEGAALFAVGHVFYFVAYCVLEKFSIKDLIIASVIFVLSAAVILFVPIFDFGGMFMQIVCLAYALIISCMLGKAISNLTKKINALNILLVVGSVLFFLSDLMLLFDVFSNVGLWAIVLCLATYYPAQCFLAYAIKVEKEVAQNASNKDKIVKKNSNCYFT